VKTFPFEAVLSRRAFSTALAMFAAVYVDAYYSILHEFWVGLTTILILQMTVRLNFQEEMLRFVVIMASVTIGTLFVLHVSPPLAVNVIMILVFITSCYIHTNYPPKISGFSPALMVGMVFLMMLMPFKSSANLLFERLHDAVLGGFIGIIAGLLVLPGRPDVDFRAGVIPIIKIYRDYFSAIAALLFKEEGASKRVDEKKSLVEKYFGEGHAYFPDWVYQRGFTANLREGHRHFLLRIEEMGEVLFALNFHARFLYPEDTLEILRAPITRCVNDIMQLMSDLMVVLEKTKLTSEPSELTEDIIILENMFQDKLALPFELLETSKEQINMLGFIYCLKDLQRILGSLEQALRAYISHYQP
jgi:hypothetical protein